MLRDLFLVTIAAFPALALTTSALLGDDSAEKGVAGLHVGRCNVQSTAIAETDWGVALDLSADQHVFPSPVGCEAIAGDGHDGSDFVQLSSADWTSPSATLSVAVTGPGIVSFWSRSSATPGQTTALTVKASVSWLPPENGGELVRSTRVQSTNVWQKNVLRILPGPCWVTFKSEALQEGPGGVFAPVDLDEVAVATEAIEHPTTFVDWKNYWGFPSADFAADPDGDGANLLVEYAFGDSPAGQNSSGAFNMSFENGYATLSVAKSSNLTDILYVVQGSRNALGNEWSTSLVELVEESPAHLKARWKTPLAQDQRCMMRVKVLYSRRAEDPIDPKAVPGRILHLHPESGFTSLRIGSDDYVSVWSDASDFGNHATQANSANRGKLASVPGMPGITGVRVGPNVAGSPASAAQWLDIPTLPSTKTIVSVVKADFPLQHGIHTSGPAFEFGVPLATSHSPHLYFSVGYGLSSNYDFFAASSGIAVQVLVNRGMTGFNKSWTTVDFWANGARQPWFQSSPVSLTPSRFGARQAPHDQSYSFDGYLLELIAYDTILSSDQIVGIQKSLLTKYGQLPRSPRINVVFDGNSITDGGNWGPGNGGEFVFALGAALNAANEPKYNVVNIAVGGQNMASMLSDVDTEVAGYFDSSCKANILVVWEGTNIISAVTAPQAWELTKQYCRAARSEGWTVVLVDTMATTRPDPWPQRQTALNALMASEWWQVADYFIAASHWPEFIDPTGPNFADGVHPSTAGYALIRDRFKDFILSTLGL